MNAAEPSACWRDALLAVALLAIDPQGLGGVRFRRAAPPARDRLLDVLRAALPDDAPVRRLPAAIPDERLLGGLDLAATLSSGRPVHMRGLLAETDGGALVIPGAERVAPGLAGRIAAALDRGVVAAERDGFGAISPARFSVIAFDDAEGDDPPPPAALSERLGIVIDLSAMRPADLAAAMPAAETIKAARRRLAGVSLDGDQQLALAEAAGALGVCGLRPLIFACAAAKVSAALAGRDAPDDADLERAARLVLGPRALCLPPAAEEEADSEKDQDAGGRDEADDASCDPRELAEKVLAAAAATLPPGLVEPAAASRSAGAAGRSGAAQASPRRGRPIGSRPGRPENGARLDLVATLRAAAPWQALRRREAPFSPPPCGEGSGVGVAPEETQRATSLDAELRRLLRDHPHPYPPHKGEGGGNVAARQKQSAAVGNWGSERLPSPRILVRREDFRIRRLKEQKRALTIFVVDASGSAALHRLAEAKGAVELLLAESYVRRDEVALIAFRGQAAELLLPPTRSLARARRSLGALPGGGGTPLASAIDAAALLTFAARRKGDAPALVFLTDGQANVARDGEGGRARAQEEALAAARTLKSLGLSALVIDVSPRPNARARELSAAMGARYLPLPAADAAALARAVAA